MSPDEFQEIVDETIKNLPNEFSEKMENVDVLIEDWPNNFEMESIKIHPGKSLLFGLYRGVPKTKRGNYYSGVLPDKIIIFAGPILLVSKDKEDAKNKIKNTVLHEIGHHFGLSDEEIYNAVKESAM